MGDTDDPFSGILTNINLVEETTSLVVIGSILLIFLLLLSALVSGAEVAFFSLTPEALKKCKESKALKTQRLFKLLNTPKKLLATILIMNNLINVAFVVISTYLTWKMFGNRSTDSILVLPLTIVNTFAIVLFGEIIPKVYASQNNLAFAKKVSGFIGAASYVFHPLAWLLQSMTSIVERNVTKKGYNLSMDELEHALEITTDDDTPKEEKEILKGIVSFGSMTVKQVMRSRIDISAFGLEMDYDELLKEVTTLGYSRIPVYEETIDKIKGILYVKDLLSHINEKNTFNWQNLIRPAVFVPENKKLDALLGDFQEKRVHVAIVVDEYGGTSGMITMEDIIEEIIGEINDEFDVEDVAYNKLDDNTYIFEGKTSLNDFCKVTATDVAIFEEEKGESESLAGLLLELHSKLPRVGDKVNFDKFVFTIVSADEKRIKRVRVYVKDNA